MNTGRSGIPANADGLDDAAEGPQDDAPDAVATDVAEAAADHAHFRDSGEGAMVPAGVEDASAAPEVTPDLSEGAQTDDAGAGDSGNAAEAEPSFEAPVSDEGATVDAADEAEGAAAAAGDRVAGDEAAAASPESSPAAAEGTITEPQADVAVLEAPEPAAEPQSARPRRRGWWSKG